MRSLRPARPARAVRVPVSASSTPPPRHNKQPLAPPPPDSPLTTALRGAAALAAAAVVSLGAASDALAAAYPTPALSPDPAKLTVQRTMVEAWDAVSSAYVDGRFGGRDWRGDLVAGLNAAAAAPDARAAYGTIAAMLDKLGDPYTRIVPPDEYSAFRVSSDGEVHGVGLLIAQDPSNRLVVLSPIEGGPAARAGIRPGDRVLAIDGHDTTGMDRESAAAAMRGSSGSSVVLRVASRADPVPTPTPGVPSRAPPPPRTAVRAVRLTRERVELSPVTASLVDGHVGYVRLASFTARAAADVRAAVTRLAADGATSYILDLRDNGGGLVRSGLDVASVWLGGGAPVFNVAGRSEPAATSPSILQRVVLPDASSAAVAPSTPLAVLVDHGSASAAEIVAGALRDNHRATLVGARTYGKGKIQTVYPLQDGSALFVTVARYVTPGNHVIDGRGIAPDAACRAGAAPGVGAPRLAASLPGLADLLAAGLQDDPCVQQAEVMLERAARRA